MYPSSTVIDAAPVTLRRARHEELHALRALLASAYVQYDVDLSAELFSRYIADLCATATDIEHTIVAESDGRIVGSVRMHPPTTPGGRAGLRALAVLPHERGAGIGRRLGCSSDRSARPRARGSGSRADSARGSTAPPSRHERGGGAFARPHS